MYFQSDSPKHYKIAMQKQSDERHKAKFGQTGPGRQACRTTVPVPMKLVTGISKYKIQN